MQIINFINDYNGALMVVITLVYVIATVAIWRANKKSAQMTEKQLEESREQFEESKRLECMPFLQLEMCFPEKASFESVIPLYYKEGVEEYHEYEIVKFRNLGNGTAVNIIYTWECKTVAKTETDCMPICAIQKQDEYYWQLTFVTDGNLPDYFCGNLCFEFNDLLGNTYEQKAHLTFSFEDDELRLEKCDMDNPKFKGVVLYSLASKADNNSFG